MSQFIESIKVEDQEIFLLNSSETCQSNIFPFRKEGSIDLAKIYKNLEHDEDGLFKLRICMIWIKESVPR
jgi:4-amino-4-deoxychorismate lyase